MRHDVTEVRRLHWGCGDITPIGWINSDIREGPGIDICCDIRDGLPLDSNRHRLYLQPARVELSWDVVDALRELHRVLKPGGVLRLSLPDLDRAIAAYQRGDWNYFSSAWDWDTLSGNFITTILWHGYIRTLFTFEFAEEVLSKAGFSDVRRVAYGQTVSSWPEIVELDGREWESFYLEAFKASTSSGVDMEAEGS